MKRLTQTLDELEGLAKQGRLFILPCKVGDTVYIISRGEIIPVKISSVIITEDGINMSAKNEQFFGYGDITLNEKKTSVEWYATEFEAEQALNS